MASKPKNGGLDYRVIFNASRNGMSFTEIDSGKVLDVNDAWIRSTGISRKKAVGKTALELGLWVNKSDRETCLAQLDKKGRVIDFETQLMMKSVETTHVISAEVVKMDGKRFALWEFQDITERKLAEDKLQESEQKFRNLFDHAIEGIYITSDDGKIISANKALAQILGYESPEVLITTITDLAHQVYVNPDDRKTATSILKEQGFLKDFETQMQKKDGVVIWVSLNVRLNKSTDGKISFEGFITDITERKRVDMELVKSERKFVDLIEQSPIVYELYDENGLQIRVNTAWEKLWGVPREYCVGKYNILKDQQILKNGWMPFIEKAFIAGEISIAPELEFNASQEPTTQGKGQRRWITTIAYPVRDETGRTCNVVVLHEDITERKHAETALQESEDFRKRIFDSSRTPIVVMDYTTYQYIDCNPAAVQMYGFSSREEVIGKTPQDFSAATQYDGTPSSDKARMYIEKAMNTGAVMFEWRHQRPGGKIWDADVHLMSFQVGDSKLLQFTLQDITERKEAEKAFKISEAKYHTLFDVANDAIFLMEEDRFVECNERTLTMFRVSRDQIIGQTPFRFSPEKQPDGKNSREKALEIIALALEGKPQSFEWLHCRYDETLFNTEVSLTRIEYLGKIQLLAIVRDVSERKKAEESLRQSEAKFRAVIENSYDGIVFIDAKGTNRFRSPSFIRITGYSDDERIGHSAFETIHPDDVEQVRRNWADLLENSEKIHKTEYRIRHKDGSYRWIEATGQNLLNHPDVQFMVITSRDITERKWTEQALKESEEMLRSIFVSTPDSITVVDLNGKIQFCNQSAANIHGYSSADQLIGKSFFELVAVEEHQRAAESMRQVLINGVVKDIPFIGLKSGGETFSGELSVSVNHDREGRPSGIVGISRDVTERKRIEDALKRSEEKYVKLFRSSQDLFVLTSLKEGRIVEINDQVQKITGFTREEVIGKSTLEMQIWVDPSQRERYIAVLLGGGIVHDWEVELRFKSGEIRNVLLWAEILDLNDGEYILGTIRDVTESKRMEMQKAKLFEELTIANERLLSEGEEKEKTQQQLRSLYAFLGKTEDRERGRIATYIHDQIIQSLVYANINLSKLKGPSDDPAFQATAGDVNRFIRQSIHDLRNLTFELSPKILFELGFVPAIKWLVRQFEEQHHLAIEFEEGDVTIPVDSEKGDILFQSLRELLTNAVKYAKSKRVKVILSFDQNVLKAVVHDDGVGMSPEQMKVGGDLTKGFGLFNIRERLRSLNGSMTVQSQSGEGTRVELTVPLHS